MDPNAGCPAAVLDRSQARPFEIDKPWSLEDSHNVRTDDNQAVSGPGFHCVGELGQRQEHSRLERCCLVGVCHDQNTGPSV